MATMFVTRFVSPHFSRKSLGHFLGPFLGLFVLRFSSRIRNGVGFVYSLLGIPFLGFFQVFVLGGVLATLLLFGPLSRVSAILSILIKFILHVGGVFCAHLRSILNKH